MWSLADQKNASGVEDQTTGDGEGHLMSQGVTRNYLNIKIIYHDNDKSKYYTITLLCVNIMIPNVFEGVAYKVHFYLNVKY